MLILSRHKGQSITIGPNVVVTILEIRGSQVRMGIEAPKQITVLREELLERDEQGPSPDETPNSLL